MRGKDTILEDADARKYRTFIGVFSRDKLLPYFKSHRAEFIKLAGYLSSGRDVAFAEFFAWYYNTVANGVADTSLLSAASQPRKNCIHTRSRRPSRDSSGLDLKS